MAWTYAGTPNSVARDAVRWLSGQTSSSDEVLATDEEITYALAQRRSNNYGAAQLVCEFLASRYAGRAQDKSIGELAITFGERSRLYATRAKELGVLQIRSQGVSPYVGGISEAEQDTDAADTDLIQPSFSVGMDRNTRTGASNPSTA